MPVKIGNGIDAAAASNWRSSALDDLPCSTPEDAPFEEDVTSTRFARTDGVAGDRMEAEHEVSSLRAGEMYFSINQ